MHRIPLLLGALHVGAVGAFTWMVVASDLLNAAPVLFIR